MKVAHFEDKPGRHEREERKAYIAAVLMADPEYLDSRVSLKAPLVMLKLLPPIFLFHLVQSFRFFLLKFFLTFFSTSGNFLTVRDPPYGEKFEIFSECGF